MRHELISHLATGRSIDKMAEVLQPETITSNFYNAKRLIRTEVVKYYVKSTIDKYKAEGITNVVYHCVDDDRTCELCREKNNTVMPIDSKDLPPTHPQCRC